MNFDVDVDVDAIEALPDFETLSYAELAELIVEQDGVEKKLSAELSLVQGRLAILRAERVRRLTPGPRRQPVIDQLDAILARRPRRDGGGRIRTSVG
jgi:RsiG-like